jgi:cytochrome c oxidase assembly factor CtaG
MTREDARWAVATLLAAVLCVLATPLALLLWLCCGRR